jgi:hypothetical protein
MSFRASRGRILGSSVRSDYFRPEKLVKMPAGVLSRIHKRLYGRFLGMPVWGVDGEVVRTVMDLDFTSGGNAGRYLYTPLDELWVEYTASPLDTALSILHEGVEYVLMRDHRWSYERAHDEANRFDMRFMRDLGSRRVVTRAGAIRALDAWWPTDAAARKLSDGA